MIDQEQGRIPLSRQAYERLRDQIITLKLAPGTLLDEAELMASLGLGRTPIREALQRLACEGLVVIRPRRGTYVAPLSLTDLQQIFELRQELEGYAAALAAERATVQDIAALEQALAPLGQVPEPSSPYFYIDVDWAFHRALAATTHNPFLQDQLGNLYNLHLRLWYSVAEKLGPVRELGEHHHAILQAIECHDCHAAEAGMRKHIQSFQACVKAVL